MTVALDDLDERILASLAADARTSVSDLAKRLKVARTTLTQRLRRLESRKIIKGYTVRLDHERMGRGQTAFVLVQAAAHSPAGFPALGNRLAGLPGVEEVHALAGEWDYVVKVRTSSVKSLYTFLERIVKERGVHRTVTLTCFRTIVEP